MLSMGWELEIYETPRGERPVANFISKLPAPLRAKVARDIDLLAEFGLQLGSPFAKKLSGAAMNLWELRTRRGTDRVRTIFSTIGERRLILLHCFLKKTRQVPRRELETAAGRLERVLGRRT